MELEPERVELEPVVEPERVEPEKALVWAVTKSLRSFAAPNFLVPPPVRESRLPSQVTAWQTHLPDRTSKSAEVWLLPLFDTFVDSLSMVSLRSGLEHFRDRDRNSKEKESLRVLQ
jgi:hypothetical protein